MGQREQTFKTKIIINPDTPFSWVRTLFPTGRDADKAKNKVRKFGRIISCEKLDTESHIGKIKFINTEKGEAVIHDRDTLKEALEFNNRVVFDDGFILNKSMRLQRIERNIKEKKTLDEILDEDDE